MSGTPPPTSATVTATASATRLPGSLRVRLLAATLAGLLLALALAGVTLAGLFRDHVERQFRHDLTGQLDQLTARLDFDAAGSPLIDAQALSDPRWQRPYSGLYWQLDEINSDGRGRNGALRSRSLWDTSLALETDVLDDGQVHVHHVPGPQQGRLLLLERTVQPAGPSASRWRLIVAADLQQTTAAVAEFNGVLALSLAVLLLLLALAAWAQVSVGLLPLRALRRSLQDVEEGRAPRLAGRFPAEVQPLVDDFNTVLERNQDVVTRARTQAGNLAHALKTPLSVLEHAAGQSDPALPRLVQEQVAMARRHIDWHLARSRAAASGRLPGQRTDAVATLGGLLRVMQKLHAGRGITLSLQQPDRAIWFAGEEQDLQEMLGNLLDNACKWARSRVSIAVELPAAPVHAGPSAGASLLIEVRDDGPGIDASQLRTVMARGVRLDESVPGSGLGLAIVQDLAALYGGSLHLANGETSGLCARLSLPATRAAD